MILRRVFAASVLIFSMLFQLQAQVTFTKIPKKLQIYGRNPVTDSAIVAIEGKIRRAGANYTEMRCKIYRNGTIQNSLTAGLAFNGDSATFTFSPSIFSELANYRFEVYGYNGTSETLITTADSVACGDAFIVTGQSNSVAWSLNGSANGNQSPFIRVLGSGNYNGSDSTWRIGQGDGLETSLANTGQWGLRMARLIVDNQKIPVAVFNGGHGGMPIQFFQRNDANAADPATNYGRMLKRVRAAGLTLGIRAVLWHQGENNSWPDGNTLSLAAYKAAFQSLMADWQADYPSIEKFYVFQIRNGCGCPADSVLKIKEAHRQLAQVSNVRVMSTSAENHHTDNCHFPYTNGYLSFGENIYRLLRRDLYGRGADNINAPNVKFAEIGNSGLALRLIMEDIMDSIVWVAGAQADFRFTGATPAVNGGSCSGYSVTLSLGSSGNGITGVGYIGHQNTPEPMVKNLNGVGALHFRNFPITTPRYRDSVSLAAILRANNLSLPVDSVSTSGSGGRIVTLRLASRNITVLPRDIGYMDSLKTIDLTSNLLTALPREITKISPTANVLVDYNRMCTVSDTIKAWVDKYSKNAEWKATQMRDSVNYCDGGIVQAIPSADPTASSPGFTHAISGGVLLLRFAHPSQVRDLSVLTLNGSTVWRMRSVPSVVRVGLAAHPKGACLVRVVTDRNSYIKRVLTY